AAIVADIYLAVGAERCAIRPAGHLRDHVLAAIGINPREPLAADLDQHHRAVRHHHRPFRKFEIGGENANIGHTNPPVFLAAFYRRFSWAAGGFAPPRAGNMSLPAVMAKWRGLAKQ